MLMFYINMLNIQPKIHSNTTSYDFQARPPPHSTRAMRAPTRTVRATRVGSSVTTARGATTAPRAPSCPRPAPGTGHHNLHMYSQGSVARNFLERKTLCNLKNIIL